MDGLLLDASKVMICIKVFEIVFDKEVEIDHMDIWSDYHYLVC